MKYVKYLLIPFIILSLILSACGGSDQTTTQAETSQQTTAPEETVPQEETATPVAINTEAAMNNFLAKIAGGNYVMASKTFLKATVFSKDLVYFDYVDEGYNDQVVMSVNDEVFQAVLTDEALDAVSYIQEGCALDAASKKLVNYWMDESVSQGNIYNLFYNIQEEPLKFVSYEDVVKQSLLSYMGYGEMALVRTSEVYMELDQEDPTSVHIEAEIEDDEVARIFYDNIDIDITFGKAEDNSIARAWMNDPVYPEARTAWTDTDEFVFNSVFLPGYGLEAVPFPSFAGYALSVDGENFITTDEAAIRDPHASEEDVSSYIQTLISNGFTETKDTDDEGTEITCYRKLLREDSKCYSSIEVEYDNGINITAKKYYDFPVYDGLDAINAEIEKLGYLPLPESENISAFHGTDRANELTESWLFFFDYNMNLYVDVEYEDYDEVTAYLDDYCQALLDAGYHQIYADKESGEIDYYESESGSASFRYHFEDDDSLTLLYKSERIYSASEAEAMIAQAGFPEIDLTDPASCRDLKKFQKVQYGIDRNFYITVTQTFPSAEEAEAFLDDYAAALEEAGFGRVNPDTIGSSKQITIYNEERDMAVCIDYYPGDDVASIYCDFRS